MGVRENPFVIEGAVPPEKFFDRREIVERFRRALERGTRRFLWAFVAPFKFGKTSLLLKLKSIAERFDDIITVLLSADNQSPIFTVVTEVLSALSGRRVNVLSDELDGDLENLRRSYLMLRKEPLASLSAFLEELWEVLRRRRRTLLLFIDEFQDLASTLRRELPCLREFTDKEIFKMLRASVDMPWAPVGLIVAGSVIERLLDVLDVWNGRFFEFHIGPFSKEDTIEMLRELFKIGGMRVSEDCVIKLAEMSGGHPYYAQMLGYTIYELGSCDDDALRVAREQLWQHISRYFHELYSAVRERGEEYVELLHRVAEGELTYEVAMKLPRDDYFRLQKLVRMGIVKYGDIGYEIVDPLFRKYVRALRMFGKRPPASLVICTDAEQEVAYALHKEGFAVLHSRYSRGPFDLYVCPRDERGLPITSMLIGVQVKFRSSDVLHLRKQEVERMKQAREKYGVIPVIAFVRGRGLIRYFTELKGTYRFDEGAKSLKEALSQLKSAERASSQD